MEGCKLSLCGSGQGQVAGYRDHSNKFSVSVTANNFVPRRTDLRSWSVGWVVGWLAGWLVVCSFGCLVGWLVCWFVGWIFGWLVGWLVTI
jgi:hypothetical protein